MNYFAHASPFLDDPYFAAGTGVPDWLSVADRRVRVRPRRAEAFVEHADPCVASVARGVLQHVRDDICFHETQAFAELSLGLTASVRELLDGESGFRPNFLGHLLVELLLDASLAAEAPDRVEAYYRTLDSVDGRRVQEAVNRMVPRKTVRLAPTIVRFCQERILWDYLEDAKLLIRLNQVMRRVKFGELPERVLDFLPEARRRVEARGAELLDGIPVEEPKARESKENEPCDSE
jgi:hypothetical protein